MKDLYLRYAGFAIPVTGILHEHFKTDIRTIRGLLGELDAKYGGFNEMFIDGKTGKMKFSGSKKSSAFAASVAAQNAAKAAMSMGMKEVEVNLKGPGSGRESAVRGLQSAGLMITIIRDRTPIAHNGCRPRKRRRV